MQFDTEYLDIFVPSIYLLLHKGHLGLKPRVLIPDHIELYLDCPSLILEIFFLSRGQRVKHWEFDVEAEDFLDFLSLNLCCIKE